MGRGTIEIKAKPLGVTAALRRFLTASERMDDQTLDAQRELGRRAEVIYGAHAPHRTGRLIRGISSSALGGSVIVKAIAKNPASGFDYVRITRFGHAVARIYPKDTGARVLATGKARAGALKFTIGGRTIFASSVAGYHPASDWAQDAFPEVSSAARTVAGRLGHRIEASF